MQNTIISSNCGFSYVYMIVRTGYFPDFFWAKCAQTKNKSLRSAYHASVGWYFFSSLGNAPFQLVLLIFLSFLGRYIKCIYILFVRIFFFFRTPPGDGRSSGQEKSHIFFNHQSLEPQFLPPLSIPLATATATVFWPPILEPRGRTNSGAAPRHPCDATPQTFGPFVSLFRNVWRQLSPEGGSNTPVYHTFWFIFMFLNRL